MEQGGRWWRLSDGCCTHVPHHLGVGTLLFAGPGSGEEEFLGQDAVVALSCAVALLRSHSAIRSLRASAGSWSRGSCWAGMIVLNAFAPARSPGQGHEGHPVPVERRKKDAGSPVRGAPTRPSAEGAPGHHGHQANTPVARGRRPWERSRLAEGSCSSRFSSTSAGAMLQQTCLALRMRTRPATTEADGAVSPAELRGRQTRGMRMVWSKGPPCAAA